VIAFCTKTDKAWKRIKSAVARLLVAAAVFCGIVAPLRAAEPETNVLFLNALDPYLPAYLVVDAAMRETLAKNTTQRFQHFTETLDAQRFSFREFEQEFVALLVKKYKGVQIDIVVVATQAALDFAIQHRNELWPDAKILFHGIPPKSLEHKTLPANIAGIVEGQKIAETLDLAQRMQPDARRLVVIAGVAGYDKNIADDTSRMLAERPNRMETEFLIGLPGLELIERIGREPASTIVLYLAQFLDREGRPYTPGEVARAISAVSPAPIYGLFETYVGGGIAGGILESYSDQGRMLAERLIQMATGAAIPAVSQVPGHCVVDARALRKWSLDEGRLPDGCEIRFAQLSIWRGYPLQSFAALAVVVLQGTLIVWLLLERQRRRRAAEQMGKARVETGQYRESLAHLVRVHTVGEMSAAITHEINQPLMAIKNYALAARRRLAGAVDAAKVEELLDKIGNQASRAGDVLHSLRAMVNKHQSEATTVEVGQLVADTLKLVEMENRNPNIRVESAITPNLPPVLADGIQVQQVVLNLTRNAIEAIEEAGIASSVITVGVAGTAKNEISVSVADSGPGIAPEDAQHIFDPFYSTKGAGLGVGLSISRAIVEAHGGQLSLTPNEGGGCVFQFTLPVTHKGN
jgi:signal transduction histidine kinase